MIVGSIFFTVLPLLLENVQGNAGHNSDSKIIAFIAFIEFLAIIALLLEHIFPSENKKNNGRVIDKLRSDKNNLITEIDKLKKEKEIVEDKNRAQNK